LSLSLLTDRSFFIPLFVVIALFAIILFRTAWIHDDAYITFRTVDNFVNGYGLTWNVSERVETYTNPLWMFLVSLVYFFTDEIYYTSIILSIVVSVITILIFAFKISKTVIGAILGIGIFIFSKAFVDYSTSGLENPLTHLILAIFLMVYIKSKNNFSFKIFFFISLLTGFGIVNRLDTFILFLPCLAYSFSKIPKIKGLYVMVIGLLPAIIWKSFSLFYYGFIFPNTAYAKVLNTGVSKNVMIQHGFVYFENLAVWHPITFFIIFLSLAIPFLIKEKHLIPIILGIILYLIFILTSGGDYMTGRLFSAPLFVAVVVLSQCNFSAFKRIHLVALAIIVIVGGIVSPGSPILSDENYTRFGVYADYIGDSRGYYYPGTGLLNHLNNIEIPKHEWATWGKNVGDEGSSPIIFRTIGMYGFYAGPEIHIIDPYGLGDPLLAKSPIPKDSWWVIGHYYRLIPSGYFETLQSGENMIEDKCLAKYYDKLFIITRGNLFDANRIQEIWKMNTGQYDYLLDAYIHGQENFQNSDC